MSSVPVAVLGAGQAGLAVSRLLTDAGVDHVVLDRGAPAQRWRSRPREALGLLTPNWMSRLPGWSYAGEIRHLAGTTAAPGLHVVGTSRKTGRSSTFLDGVRHDAALVVGRVLADLGARTLERAA